MTVLPMAWLMVRGHWPGLASVPMAAVFFAASAKSSPPWATAFLPLAPAEDPAGVSSPSPVDPPQAVRDSAAARARGCCGGAAAAGKTWEGSPSSGELR